MTLNDDLMLLVDIKAFLGNCSYKPPQSNPYELTGSINSSTLKFIYN